MKDLGGLRLLREVSFCKSGFEESVKEIILILGLSGIS